MDTLGRPLLRPGWQAARYDDHHLQVGLDAPARTVLTDSPAVRRLLARLTDPDQVWKPPESLPAMRALDKLREAGLLVPSPGSPFETRLAAEFGPSARSRMAARRAVRVSVDAPPGLDGTLVSLLRAEGVQPVPGPADIAVVLALGPVRRTRLDPLVQDGSPHLVVSGGPASWEIGPFVVPGRTACLRCVDATLAETEPRRAVVTDQFADAPGAVPTSPALQTAALALAVRDVLAYVDGDRPATWSASLLLGAAGAPALREWARHPYCGCAWDVLLTDEP